MRKRKDQRGSGGERKGLLSPEEMVKQGRRAAAGLPESVRDDAAQEFALAAIRVIPQVRRGEPGAAFQATAGRYAIGHFVRRGGLRPACVFSLDGLLERAGDRSHPLTMQDGRAEDPAERVEREQVAMAVRAAVAQLSRSHRRAVELVFFRGLLLREAGAKMGVTESRVCQLLRESRAALRLMLAPLRSEVDGRSGGSGGCG